MDNEKTLQFIAEKIEDIQLAIFYCHSKSPLKIHNTIIHSSKVDETGCVTFFINRPQQLISQFDQEFPVELSYFRKGNGYYLNIFGKARIVNDPEELAYQADLTPEELENALTTKVLIRVKILQADFRDYNFEKKNLFFKKMTSLFSSLFDSTRGVSGSYNFSGNQSIHTYGF